MFGRSAWRLRRNPATFPQPMRTSRERASCSGGSRGWGLMKGLPASVRGFASCCAWARGLRRDSAQRSGSARTAGAFSISHVWLRVEASTRRVRHIRRLAQVRPALSRGRPVTRSKRIRVMYVVPDLGVGGAERHVTRLMPNLDRSRFDTVVVCIGIEGNLFGDLAGSGTRAVALHRPRKRSFRSVMSRTSPIGSKDSVMRSRYVSGSARAGGRVSRANSRSRTSRGGTRNY